MQIDLQQQFFGNSLQQYFFAIAAIAVAYIIMQVVRRWLVGLVKKLTAKTQNSYDDLVIALVEKFIIPYLYLVVNFNILRQLNLPVRIDRILDVALTLITVIFAARLINYFIHSSLQRYMEKRNEAASRLKQFTGILIVIKVVVWSLGILFFLDNVGYDVTTVIAGLGVGGIAVALAAQNILGDLFSYFVIFFDKPFEIGDAIAVGGKSGTVERIGIKTSHIRTLSGEQLVMPNAELVKSAIHNYKRQERRRVVFIVGVDYETPPDLLEQIPGIIKEIVSSHEFSTIDRSHLQGFGDFSINFETVYFIEKADYNLFMDTHQAVCLQVLRRFAQLGIKIAYPTQKLFVETEVVGKAEEAKPPSIISDIKSGEQ